MTCFRTIEPRLHESGHLLEPRHSVGVTAEDNDRQIAVGFSQGANEFVLTVRQVVLQPVVTLRVLVVGFVQSADEQYDIRLFGSSHGFGCEFGRCAAVAKVLTGSHTVVLAANVAHVAAYITNLGTRLCGALAYALQRRNLVLRLERTGAAAYSHLFDGILAYHKDRFLVLSNREHRLGGFLLAYRIVLKQNDTFTGYLPCSRNMRIGTERTETFVRVHRCTENQPQHVAHLVVEFLGTDLAALDFLQVGQGKVIHVVGVRAPFGQSVSPRAELQIQTVADSFIGIAHATPIGDNRSVESPLAAKYIHEQTVVVAGVLSPNTVVRAHYAP